MAQDRYTLWRRRLAPFGLLLAIGVLVHQNVSKETAGATIVFWASESAARQVGALEAELLPRGEDLVLATYSRRDLGGSPASQLARWELPTLDAEMYDLRVSIEVGGGRVERIERAVELRDGAEIRVDVTGGVEVAAR